jgi:hypothetical protein
VTNTHSTPSFVGNGDSYAIRITPTAEKAPQQASVGEFVELGAQAPWQRRRLGDHDPRPGDPEGSR